MAKEFYCPTCDHTYTSEPDEYGLFNGRGMAVCPICGECGYNPSDYHDWTCNICGHKWRKYGNGGLVFGCVPRCPNCYN